ncbi:MAG: putative hydrolase [Pedosphaera sp.]|nr:putative hydrolase [Pedosphaera sp.]
MRCPNKFVAGSAALALAAVIWISCLHFFFANGLVAFRQGNGLSRKAQQLAARHLGLWTNPNQRQQEVDRMRARNPEWDLMAGSFLVWSLAEMGLRNPSAKAAYLKTMDQIIEETLHLEREHGIYYFLMPVAKDRPYVMQPARNQFLDGESALMLASRRSLEEKPGYQPLLRERIDLMLARMQLSPVLSAESYPDTCWTFDNLISLCAVRLADGLDGTDHSRFLHQWLTMAKLKLMDQRTGLLLTSYTTAGRPLKGPEGSSVWMVAHCLRLLDEDFARDQYQRARKEFGRTLAGFAWSRKCPGSGQGPLNKDANPTIPFLEISAGASGMAFIGASSFGDAGYLTALAATLDFSAFPSLKEGRLKYCASNQVGDAVLLYATVLGPLWEKTKDQRRASDANK